MITLLKLRVRASAQSLDGHFQQHQEQGSERNGKGTPIYRPKYMAEEQTLRHIE